MTSHQLIPKLPTEQARSSDPNSVGAMMKSPQRKSVKTPLPVTPLGILAEKLLQLTKQAEALSQLDSDFTQALKEATWLATGLEPYTKACSTEESVELAELSRKTQMEDWPNRFSSGETVAELEQEMLSGHIEGQFLQLLLQGMRAKRVLEIGLFTGYSALAMAEALPEDGILIACEIDAYAARFAKDCFAKSPHSHKIQIKLGPAINSMRSLADAKESFDFVFIDANKDGYVDYLDLLLESSLLAPNGLVCVDNTLMQGQPYMPGEMTANGRAIAHFNKAVAADARVQQVLLPIRDGVTLIRRSHGG